jgi:hypothetical protein
MLTVTQQESISKLDHRPQELRLRLKPGFPAISNGQRDASVSREDCCKVVVSRALPG